jgi:hypothetical protein
MRSLILHPTDISQWYSLVNEAQASTRLVLSENTESYLVFLLMRFTHVPQLVESVLALDVLESMNKPRLLQQELLREVGDKSLLFCGLFPGMAKKRRVSLDYFTEMGQTAYMTASELFQDNTELYQQLSMQFPALQQILQAMRGEYVLFSETNSNIISSWHPTKQ